MPDDKKIIIDEDWKSRVQAEKAEAATSKSQSAAAATGTQPDSRVVGDMPMPLASFELLLTTLATEALVALGQVPHPATGKPLVHREQAKFLIDTLDVLKQKTAGNLSADEQQLLDSLLHQMRMVFIETGNQPSNAEVATDPNRVEG